MIKCLYCAVTAGELTLITRWSQNNATDYSWICSNCLAKNGFYCQKHDATHTIFMINKHCKHACLQCIDDLVAGMAAKAVAYYRRILSAINSHDEEALLRSWFDNNGQMSFLRILMLTAYCNDHHDVDDVIGMIEQTGSLAVLIMSDLLVW